MPIHIEGAVDPSVACGAKVSQRNAPGAMSAMAFIVNPVNPKVGVILTSPVFSAMYSPYIFFISLLNPKAVKPLHEPNVVPRDEILVGCSGVVKCNVSMPQITDSYGCHARLRRAA
jgi:hypothetical protein